MVAVVARRGRGSCRPSCRAGRSRRGSTSSGAAGGGCRRRSPCCGSAACRPRGSPAGAPGSAPAISLVVDDVGQAGAGADGQAAGLAGDAGQGLDVLEVDDPLGAGDVVLHPADQVGAAGEGLGGRRPARALTASSTLAGLAYSKAFMGHAFPSGLARAFRTFMGDIGHSGTRTPMALVTALPIAAAVLIVGGSPTPMTPRPRISGVS